MERNDLLMELHARMERYRTARAALRRAAEGDDTTALDAKVRADCTVPQQLHHAWQEALPPLLTQSELFAREFSRQQAALNDLSRLCARAARLRRFGEYLRDRLRQARTALDDGKLTAILSSGSFLTADLKYRRMEQIQALGRELRPLSDRFCQEMGAFGLPISLDTSAEIEALQDDAARMMDCLGISNGRFSAADELNKVRTRWAGAAARLEDALEQLRIFHIQRLEALSRRQAAFSKLLENAGGGKL